MPSAPTFSIRRLYLRYDPLDRSLYTALALSSHGTSVSVSGGMSTQSARRTVMEYSCISPSHTSMWYARGLCHSSIYWTHWSQKAFHVGHRPGWMKFSCPYSLAKSLPPRTLDDPCTGVPVMGNLCCVSCARTRHVLVVRASCADAHWLSSRNTAPHFLSTSSRRLYSATFSSMPFRWWTMRTLRL